MQAVILGISGISELHRRKASLVHICCASALKAKLARDDSSEKEAAQASTKPAWQMVLKKDAVMVGSCCPGLGTGSFRMGLSLPQPPGADCDVHHSAAPADESI
jgi:hypothetical protein